MRERINIKHMAVAGLFVLVVTGILTLATEKKMEVAWQNKQIASVIQAMQDSIKVRSVDIKQNISLEAKSAIVYDVLTGEILYEKNADEVLPLASLTKLITAVVANKHFGKGKIYLSERALLTEGDSGLIAGDVWNRKQLTGYMLMVSSNDAAVAFAENNGGRGKFINEMNSFSSRLGLDSFKFYDESGLDINTVKSGGYGSAKDMAYFMSYIITSQPNLLSDTSKNNKEFTSLSGRMYNAKNTNKIINLVPNLIGGKTGYTDLAGGNLVIGFDNGFGHPIVIVVLGSSMDGRFADVLRLINAMLY